MDPVTWFFVLLSSKGSFMYFWNIWWILLDVLIVYMGLETGRWRGLPIMKLVSISMAYILLVGFRDLVLLRTGLAYYGGDLLFYFKYFITAALFVLYHGHSFRARLVRVMYVLALISLPFFVLQILFPDALWAFVSAIRLPPRMNGEDYKSILVFTFDRRHMMRNSGFSWEPGAYGCMLVFTLMLRLLDRDLKLDRVVLVLVLASLTTLSTTAYLGLVILMIWYLRLRGVSLTRLMVFLIPLIVVVAALVPFLASKIVEIYRLDLNSVNEFEELAGYYSSIGAEMPLNRFASLRVIVDLLGPKLLLGVGNEYQTIFPALRAVSISNGIVDMCAKIGIAGFGLYLFQFKELLRAYKIPRRLWVYPVLLLLVVGFGEPVLNLPFFLVVFFFPLLGKPDEAPAERNSMTYAY